ncbi:YlmH family RNA-binding protein [Bombilactobacillus thymidiniphilus]|uniref:YlmH/Sll1252 family protein n=1 Tax=Bombilactobacillus thymidiniphilus TaxID=2923363 RepID=A0ABY4PDJ3_9LACO|nr:YlmH/Sll1252 family protein [Bombilactobacillus thymidiniphilus]UQS83786.1 YlmH/Sll1252 family protein [Bombilactobacillus thymidiniphilus]
MTIKNSETNFKIKSLITAVDRYYTKQVSHFLNPYELQQTTKLLLVRSDLQLQTSGGYPQAQRKRILLCPEYDKVQDDDFAVSLLQINFNSKFVKLDHSQIMGTLLNLGLDRDCFGDIVTDGIHWQFFAMQEFSDLLEREVTRIGHQRVKVSQIPLEKLLLVRDDFVNKNILSSSLRLDNVISNVFGMSRQQVKDLIKHGQVSVNWLRQDNLDYLVMLGDTISVRGFGRVAVMDLLGQSRQKFKLYVKIYRR